jgi:hypothetical protein
VLPAGPESQGLVQEFRRFLASHIAVQREAATARRKRPWVRLLACFPPAASMDSNVARACLSLDERTASAEVSGDVVAIKRAFYEHLAIRCNGA